MCYLSEGDKFYMRATGARGYLPRASRPRRRLLPLCPRPSKSGFSANIDRPAPTFARSYIYLIL